MKQFWRSDLNLGQLLLCGGHLGLQAGPALLVGPQSVRALGQLATQTDAVLPEPGQLCVLPAGRLQPETQSDAAAASLSAQFA